MANTMYISKTNDFTVTDEKRYNMLIKGIYAEDFEEFNPPINQRTHRIYKPDSAENKNNILCDKNGNELTEEDIFESAEVYTKDAETNEITLFTIRDADKQGRIIHGFGGYSWLEEYIPPYELVPEIMNIINVGKKIYDEDKNEINLESDWYENDEFYDENDNLIYERDYDTLSENFENVFIPELQKILTDDSYVLLTNICYEKLRFVTGGCTIITKDKTAYVSLESAVADKLREMNIIIPNNFYLN